MKLHNLIFIISLFFLCFVGMASAAKLAPIDTIESLSSSLVGTGEGSFDFVQDDIYSRINANGYATDMYVRAYSSTTDGVYLTLWRAENCTFRKIYKSERFDLSAGTNHIVTNISVKKGDYWGITVPNDNNKIYRSTGSGFTRYIRYYSGEITNNTTADFSKWSSVSGILLMNITGTVTSTQYEFPVNYAPAPYNSARSISPNSGINVSTEGHIEIFSLTNNYRIRQKGNITQINIPEGENAPNITNFQVSIWRRSTTSTNLFTRVATTPNLAPIASGLSSKTIDPIPVLEGDYYSVIIDCPANTQAIVTRSGSTYYFSRYAYSGVTDTNYDWVNAPNTVSEFIGVELMGDHPDITCIGDSITTGMCSGSQNNLAFIDQAAGSYGPMSPFTSYPYYLSQLTGKKVQNVGVTSQSTATIGARFERDAINQFPDYIIMLEGGVDANAGTVATTIKNNVESQIKLAEYYNIVPVALHLTHSSTFSDAANTIEDQFNDLLDDLRQTHPNLRVIDANEYLNTYRKTGPWNNTWNVVSALSPDGLHYYPAGYYEIAKQVYAKYDIPQHPYYGSEPTDGLTNAFTGAYKASENLSLLNDHALKFKNVTASKVNSLAVNVTQIYPKSSIYDVPINGLVAEYRFDDNLTDISGNGLNGVGTYIDGNYTQGSHGNASKFLVNTGSKVVLPSNSLFNLGSNWTIAFEMNASSNTGYIYSKCNMENGIAIGIDGTVMNVELKDGSGHSYEFYSTPPLNIPVHLVFKYDGSTISVYRDGILTSQKYIGITPTTTTNQATIGQSAYGAASTGYSGTLDDFLIYNRTLNDSEVKQVFYDSVHDANFNTSTNITHSSNVSGAGSVVVPFSQTDSNFGEIYTYGPNTTTQNGIYISNYTYTASPFTVEAQINMSENVSLLTNNTTNVHVQHTPLRDYSSGQIALTGPTNCELVSNNPSASLIADGTNYKISTGAITAGTTYSYNITQEAEPVILPDANITANITSGTYPLAVLFTDNSAGSPTSWAWNFGDGTANNTSQNPSHIFGAGTFNITLTVTNVNGSDTESKIGYITVSKATPTISWSNPSDIEEGTALSSTQLNAVVNGYDSQVLPGTKTYNPDSGTVLSAGNNQALGLSFNPTDSTNYTTATATVHINVAESQSSNPPIADFSANVTSGTVPLTISFTGSNSGGTADEYNYSFGDGSYSTTINAVHTYSAVGTYTVSLWMHNEDGVDTRTRTNYITVSAVPILPTADFSTNVSSGYVPLYVNFTSSSLNATSFSWNFGDGTTSTSENVTHIYSQHGTYTATLTASNSNGTSTKSATIIANIVPIYPVANFTANQTTGQIPMSVRFTSLSTNATGYNWSFGDNTSNSTSQNPVHTFSTVGSFNISLTATNANGTNTTIKTNYITTTPRTPITDFYANKTDPGIGNTGPLTVHLYDSSKNSPTNWSWNLGDGNTSTEQNPTHTYYKTGGTNVTLNTSNAVGSSNLTKYNYIYVPATTTDINYIKWIIKTHIPWWNN